LCFSGKNQVYIGLAAAFLFLPTQSLLPKLFAKFTANPAAKAVHWRPFRKSSGASWPPLWFTVSLLPFSAFKGDFMHPVHDVDALLVLATALASKRRPAELLEIVAAADLLNNNVPGELKIVDAFERLSKNGLICEIDGGYALTSAAQAIVTDLPRKAETAERLFAIKDNLSLFNVKGEHAVVVLAAEQVTAAIQAHRAAGKTAAKNLLVPKPKPEAEVHKPGQRQRKPMPARKRKV
jgi:hypothetical protein